MFLDLYKRAVNRREGLGTNIPKLHQMLHIAEDISRFGAHPNVETGTSESRHKAHCKAPGKQTQRRGQLLEKQVGIRHAENVVIDFAMANLQTFKSDKEEAVPAKSKAPFGNPQLRIYRDKMRFAATNETIQKLYNDDLHALIVNEYMHTHLWPNVTSATEYVNVYTCWHSPELGIIRADPCKPWFDWVTVSWTQGHSTVESYAQLIMFIQTPAELPDVWIDGMHVQPRTMYALLHLVYNNDKPYEPIKAHLASKVLLWVEKDMNGRFPAMYLYPIESITGTAIGVPGDPDTDPLMQQDHIIVQSRARWYNLYQQHIQSTLSKRNRT